MIVPAGLSSSAAVAVALVVVSSLHLAVAAGQQPSFRGRDIAGSGGPCALAVAPLGYPCEEHQVLCSFHPDLGMHDRGRIRFAHTRKRIPPASIRRQEERKERKAFARALIGSNSLETCVRR